MELVPENSTKFREEFKKSLKKFVIERAETFPEEDIRNFLLHSTAEWLPLDSRFDETSVLSCLQFIGDTYSERYRNNDFIHAAFRIVSLYYGEECERQFKERIQRRAQYRKNEPEGSVSANFRALTV